MSAEIKGLILKTIKKYKPRHIFKKPIGKGCPPLPLGSAVLVVRSPFPSPSALFGAAGRLCCAVGGLCVLFGFVRLRRSPVRSSSVVFSLLALALLSVCSVALAPPGLCPCPPLSRGLCASV